MTSNPVIASREAAKQSSRGGPHTGLLRSAMTRPARNDAESCHCEPRSGEAIQPGKPSHRIALLGNDTARSQ
ncbi:MAG: hypothetical protein LBT00_15015 [Spirochaetaceae bacterium]|nr:hypothetical protein [Spirochaetaceae bacterium]